MFDNFTLKIMAIIFMTMDHMYTILPKEFNIPIWFGYFGKLAAPIFFYLAVEGFYYTSSRKKYISRVLSMGLVMVFVDIVFKIHNNIFLSIGFGLLMLSGIELLKNSIQDNINKLKGIVLTVLFFILGLTTEASLYGVGMFLIFYLFRNNKLVTYFVYSLFSLFSLFPLINFIGPDFLEAAMLWDYQWMMIFAIIPISMYNGKLGLNNRFTKWLFYWFYPLHLIVLTVISYI